MRKIVGVIVFLAVSVVPQLYSQVSFPTSLPGLNIDGVSAFYRMSRLSGASGWRPSPTAPCPGSTGFPMCGWGFELVYDLTAKENGTTPTPTPAVKHWLEAEIAVGYDFLNVHATTRNGGNYELFGSIQTLPSITLYVSHDFPGRTSAYLGLGTGLVVLKNARAYDRDGKIWAIAGDTWGFTPSVGGIFRIREADKDHLGILVFLEGSYEVRNFTSLTYTLPTGQTMLPSELPRNLRGSGFVLNMGFEVKFAKKLPPKS